MTEQKWVINGIEAPADADIYAEGSFRKLRGKYFVDFWSRIDLCWKSGVFSLQECENASDYQERPVAMVNTKWPVPYKPEPEGAEFFAKGGYRKIVDGFENPYVWTSAFWQDGGYTLEECKKSKDYVEKPVSPSVTCVVTEESTQPEYTGGSVNYYKCFVASPTTLDLPYYAECNDIIEALGMTFAEGNAFKAIWRRCAARTYGSMKKGYDNGLYDAEKVVFFGERMIEQSKLVKEGQ